MSRFIRDGTVGQRYVLSCDACGASIVAASLDERERERADRGWTLAGSGRDLCPRCRERSGSAPGRRFTRPS